MSNDYLTEADILGALDLPEMDVEIPEWPGRDGKPGRVRIRAISKAAQQHIRNISRDAAGNIDASRVEMAMILACVVKPALSESRIEDFKQKRASAWDRIMRKVAELNGSATPAEGVPAEAAFLQGASQQEINARNDGRDSIVSGNGASA